MIADRAVDVYARTRGKMLIEVTGELEINEGVREWCRLPYPGHPKGCPNYAIAEECPPKVKKVNEIFDLSKPHYFAVQEFDLMDWAQLMKLRHPKWSDKQARCCLYWQNTVRKKLRNICEAQIGLSERIYTLLPEAMGVNVFVSARKFGINIDRLAFPTIYKIALIGYPLPTKVMAAELEIVNEL
jgi:hypothetical protein